MESVVSRLQNVRYRQSILYDKVEHDGVLPSLGSEEAPVDSRIDKELSFILWDPKFLKFIRDVTGCGIVKALALRVYKMSPGHDHHFDWHSDVIDNSRMVGISLNLSPKPFSGGQFQIRKNRRNARIYKHTNTGFGDALIFKISPDLSHRVTRMRGKNPKISLAGWFQNKITSN